MSSIANPQPEQPTAEELVAYLDGELPPEAGRRVEERLAADAAYRQQLQNLDQAWAVLDALPATNTDDDFARTTMQLVTVAAEDEVSRETARAATAQRRRRRRWIVAGVAAAAIGFVAAWALLPDGNDALLADLPVIRQAELLTYVADIEFLRRLPAAVPLEQLMDDESNSYDELTHLAPVGAPSLDIRRQWVESLPPEEKSTLAGQARRFHNLPASEKLRLRELEREIRQADDAAELQTSLLAYGQWLARLTPGEQEQLHEELEGLAVDEQVARVRQFVRQTSERASRQLSADDAEKLRKEIFEVVEERRSAILNEMRPRGEGGPPRRLDEPRGALFVLSRELRDRDREKQLRQRLVAQLSEDARAHLERLGPWSQRLQLWQWVRDSLQPKWGPGELEQFFVSQLDNNQRQRLLNLRPGEMQAELERLYLGHHFGFRDTEPWRGGEAGDGRRIAPPAAPPSRRDERRPPNRPAPPRDRRAI